MTIKFSDPTHPAWSLLRLAIIMLSLIILLALVAEKFDKTELQTIIGMFMVAGGIEGVTQYTRSRQKGE